MFIDHQQKFLFVAVPKTASGSVHFYFNQPPLYDGFHVYFMEKYHYPYRWILTDHPEAADYFSFGFTRNPWDRMVSSWFDFTNSQGHRKIWSERLTLYKDFQQFIMEFPNSEWAQEIHFQPASWYLGHGTEQVDFTGRYESIDEDFGHILRKLGRPEFALTSKQKLRKSARNADYHQYYTNEMIEIVGNHFHDDIVNFGYQY